MAAPLAQQLSEAFVNRTDAWVRQQPDGAYRTLRLPLTEAVIARHLAGEISVHVHALGPKATCGWAALDLDAHLPGLAPDAALPRPTRAAMVTLVQSLSLALEDLCDGPPLVEATGGHGLHVWVPFARPVPAALAAALSEAAMRVAGLDPGGRPAASAPEGIVVERYPKQLTLSAGELGNSLRLPLGVHPGSGRRSVLLEPARGQVLDPAEALAALPRPDAEALARSLRDHGHPRAPERPSPPRWTSPRRGARPAAPLPGDRPARPDAWSTYRWACSVLGLGDRTNSEPRGEWGHVRCLFPAAHAHGDRTGNGSAYLIRRGADQVYGCFVCTPAIDTIELVRRIRPQLRFGEVLDLAHQIDPSRCPSREERAEAYRARAGAGA